MAEIGELDPGRRAHQLHVELGSGDLEQLVDEITQGALEAVGEWLAGDPGENRTVLHAALRQGMKRYIVAYDVCGASSFCSEASRFDPWA